MIEYQNRKIEQSFAPNKPKYVSHNGNFAIQANLPLRTKHNRYNENNERIDRTEVNKLEYKKFDTIVEGFQLKLDMYLLHPKKPLPKPTPLSEYENINNGLFKKFNKPIIHKPKRTIRTLVSVADCDLYRIFEH